MSCASLPNVISHHRSHHNLHRQRPQHSKVPSNLQTNLPHPLSNFISPVAETYDEDDHFQIGDSDDIFDSDENLDLDHVLSSTSQKPELINTRVASQNPEDLSTSRDSEELLDEQLDFYPESLNPFFSNRSRSRRSRKVGNLSNQSLVEPTARELATNLDPSVRSTGAWSVQSLPVDFSPPPERANSQLSMAYLSHTTSGNPMAAEISKSRYALQNKKLLEELEQRTLVETFCGFCYIYMSEFVCVLQCFLHLFSRKALSRRHASHPIKQLSMYVCVVI